MLELRKFFNLTIFTIEYLMPNHEINVHVQGRTNGAGGGGGGTPPPPPPPRWWGGRRGGGGGGGASPPPPAPEIFLEY